MGKIERLELPRRRAADAVSRAPMDRLGRVDQRAWAARLGAGLYLGGALVVLTTAPLLPHSIDRMPLYAAGGVALGAAGVVPLLPWRRWPESALALLAAAAFVLFAVAGHAAPGALPTYLPLYSLTFLYLGLTQSRWVILAAAPVAATSLFIGAGMGRSAAVAAAIGVPVWGSVGLVLEGFRSRQRRSATMTEHLLAGAVALGRAADEGEVAELIASLAETVLEADIVVVVVREQPASARLVTVASRGLDASAASTADARVEADGLTWVLRSGEPLVLGAPDAAQFAPRSIDESMIRAALYLPLPGEGGQVGAVAGIWSHRGRPDSDTVRASVLLADEAGAALERVRDGARLTALADTDPLTNVPNRRMYQRTLDAMTSGDAVVLLDLDHFKRVNDEHGHAVGDETLRAFAACLTSVARDIDCVARYGGEEFAMVLAGAGATGAEAVLVRLRAQWAATEPKATFSAGIAVHEPRSSPALTLGRADAALYRAKDNGRDRCEVAEPSSGLL